MEIYYCPTNLLVNLFNVRHDKCLRPMAMAPDMNLAFAAVARREYIRVGSAQHRAPWMARMPIMQEHLSALLAKATATNTKFMPLELARQR